MKKFIKWGLGIFLVIIIIGAISGGDTTEGDESSNDSTSEVAAANPEEKQDVEAAKVDMAAFVAEFDSNQLSAEKKYEGKYVSSNGFIDNISEDILGDEFVSLNPNNEEYYFGTSVQCFINNSDQILSLSNGEQVNFTGKVDSQSFGIIVLKDCSISK